ncbi:hypothetical protein BDD12DRAFT_806400 [Trichophaea hybrida]|nr:hypothetical protein BDD12DRAFT_806400 [Trichophaea hybrida]
MIDSCGNLNALRYLQNVGTNRDPRYMKTIALGDQALSTKCRIFHMTGFHRHDSARKGLVISEYLEEQARKQEQYDTNYKKPREDEHDNIFELLQSEQRISVEIPLRRANRTRRLGFQISEQLLAQARDNPRDLEALSHTLEGSIVADRLSSLMDKTNTAREHWAHDEELYQQCHRSVASRMIRRIQAQVIQVITHRTIEPDILHRRTRGHKQAKKVITRINSRWRPLDKLVKYYNIDAAQINLLLFERYKVVDNMLKIKNDGLLSLQRRQELLGLQLQIAEILKPIPLPPPPLAPAVSEQKEVEGEDEEITEAIEDVLFDVHGHSLEEEEAARIMMQEEIERGHRDGIGSDGDCGNVSGILQD